MTTPKNHELTNDTLPIEAMMQAAMSAYIDEAQKTDHAHDRLVRASRAAGLAVASVLREAGMLRPPLIQEASHGTYSGNSSGCKCQFCLDAGALYQRAWRHWTAETGSNKVSL